jgi:hypothetical protein
LKRLPTRSPPLSEPNDAVDLTLVSEDRGAGRFTASIPAIPGTIRTARQADPGWDESDQTRAPLRDPKMLAQNDQPDGYQEFLTALRDETVAFRRPVVGVNGDSHYFRIDKPLQDSQGRRVENFTRVETFGDHQENGNNDVHWLKVDVDPRSREVFSYQPQIVPGNRPAVPAP